MRIPAVAVGVAALLLLGCAKDEPAISDQENNICINYANAQFPNVNLIRTWQSLYDECIMRNGYMGN